MINRLLNNPILNYEYIHSVEEETTSQINFILKNHPSMNCGLFVEMLKTYHNGSNPFGLIEQIIEHGILIYKQDNVIYENKIIKIIRNTDFEKVFEFTENELEQFIFSKYRKNLNDEVLRNYLTTKDLSYLIESLHNKIKIDYILD